MKKFYSLLITCCLGIFIANAQRETGVSIAVKQLTKTGSVIQKTEADGCDTIYKPIPDNWHLTLKKIFVGGYISGTNAYGDKEKADYYDLSADAYTYITGASIYFGVAKTSNSDHLSKNINFKVYEDNGGIPGAQIGSSVSLPLSSIVDDVNNGAITNIMFPAPIALPASKKFYVSADISNFSVDAGDTIALVQTDYGDLPAGTGIAWERQMDNNWYNTNSGNSWAADFAWVIQPYVGIMADACAVLPVNLVSFNAERHDKAVTLNWNVANEINMKGYELERSDNNNNYRPVAFISAYNSSKNQSYTYTDANAFSTASSVQYRLKQTDNDGRAVYSNIVSVKASSLINVIKFSNPFNNALTVQLNLASASEVSITIYDIKGNLAGSEKISLPAAASNAIQVKSTSLLKSGTYILKIVAGEEKFSYKIIKN